MSRRHKRSRKYLQGDSLTHQATYPPQRRRSPMSDEPVILAEDASIVFDLESEMYSDSIGDYSGKKMQKAKAVRDPMSGFEEEFFGVIGGVGFNWNKETTLLGKLEKS